MIYESFEEWVRENVLAHRQLHPTWFRLDGRTQNGNQTIFAKFKHLDLIWKVHADTRFDPVLRAYDAIINGTHPHPLRMTRTRNDRSDCLTLIPELEDGPNKYFYVYLA